MQAIEIARQLAQLGEAEKAQNAYRVALQGELAPEERLEASFFILQSGGNYKTAYTCFLELYQEGHFHPELLDVMTQAFYAPNVKDLRGRYERNCKLLEKYPYLFRRDFPDFEELPVQFFPYDDNCFVPYYPDQDRFGDYIDLIKPEITRNFFRNLDKPVLAADVYSQYELEYLCDNVRKSEYVGRENHIYLHYKNWGEFCSYLQCLNLRPLLKDEKIVFLIDDEVSQYPIDFQARYGIDYSQFPVKPLSIREVTRLIWHTQLSTHNGGDFFNEIFDGHPNLLCLTSIMFDSVEEVVASWRESIALVKSSKEKEQEFINNFPDRRGHILRELFRMQNPTDKDIFVAFYLSDQRIAQSLDPAARIAPAVFFQPHFHNINYELFVDKRDNTVLSSGQYDKTISSPVFRGFKYIKTFTPMRRFTTSHGATVRFMYNSALEEERKKESGESKETTTFVVPDAVSQRVLNRSFMVDWQDRLYQDCVLVRLEDGKLNPKATFHALCEFLDLPYHECMTYGSEFGERLDYGSYLNGVFDTAPVYRTYDEFTNDSERKYIEYFLRDAYECYGYDFHFYDGQPMTVEQTDELAEGFTTIDSYIRKTWAKLYEKMNITVSGGPDQEEAKRLARQKLLDKQVEAFHENRRNNNRILSRGLNFVNRAGQPLHMMPMLKLNPELLENPIYH